MQQKIYQSEFGRQADRDMDDPDNLYHMGNAALENENVPAALECFFRATVKAPDNPEILERIAFCLQYRDLHHEAARYYKAVHKLGKTTVSVVDNLVTCLRECGNVEDVDRILEHYDKSSNLSQRMCNTKAIILFGQGDEKKALQYVARALDVDPTHTASLGLQETILAKQKWSNSTTEKARLKIALHMSLAFHYSILKPIFDALKPFYDVILTDDFCWVRDFRPDFVFIADAKSARLRSDLPNSKFVYTRHGLISKNFIYSAAHKCDYVCVTSESQRDDFIRIGKFEPEQIWLTGFSQMDPMFRGEIAPIDINLDSRRKCVLFAPTFTDRFSALPMLAPFWNEEFIESLGDIDIVIKPHPLIMTRQKAAHSQLIKIAKTYEHIHLVDGLGVDVVPYLMRADVLVSDASSVMFQYLVLDRPVIAFNNPNRFDGQWYDPEGIEWKWRDMMEEIDNPANLPAILKGCFDNPSKKSDKRAQYHEQLFGSVTDGRTGEHILEYLKKLLPVSPGINENE